MWHVSWAGSPSKAAGIDNNNNKEVKNLSFQITASIAPKFEKLIQAVRSIRKAVQDTVDAGRIYTRAQRAPDEVCKDATDLKEDPDFPGVGFCFHDNMVVRLSRIVTAIHYSSAYI